MGQNANSQYARMVASNKKKAPERCAKYGIKNQGTALSGWKQFTCAKFSYFFYGSVKSFTDYFPYYGGFTSRADCFALPPWWLPSPSCSSCAGLFTSATTSSRCRSFTSAEMGVAGSFLRTSERPPAGSTAATACRIAGALVSSQSTSLPLRRLRPQSYFLRLARRCREGQRAKIEVVRPPRGVNSPRTTHHSGRTAATISWRILFTAFS
jgi:hypothetical protein